MCVRVQSQFLHLDGDTHQQVIALGHCLALLPILCPDEHALVADDDSVCVWVLSDGVPQSTLRQRGTVDDGNAKLLVRSVVATEDLIVYSSDGPLVANFKLWPCVHQ